MEQMLSGIIEIGGEVCQAPTSDYLDLNSMRRETLSPPPSTVATTTRTTTIRRQIFEYDHRLSDNSVTLRIGNQYHQQTTQTRQYKSLYTEEEKAYFESVLNHAEAKIKQQNEEAAKVVDVIDVSDTEYETELELRIANRPRRLNRNKTRLGDENGLREEPLNNNILNCIQPILPIINNIIQHREINSSTNLTANNVCQVTSASINNNPYENLFDDIDISSSIQSVQIQSTGNWNIQPLPIPTPNLNPPLPVPPLNLILQPLPVPPPNMNPPLPVPPPDLNLLNTAYTSLSYETCRNKVNNDLPSMEFTDNPSEIITRPHSMGKTKSMEINNKLQKSTETININQNQSLKESIPRRTSTMTSQDNSETLNHCSSFNIPNNLMKPSVSSHFKPKKDVNNDKNVTTNQEKTPVKIIPKVIIQPPTPKNSLPLSPTDLFGSEYINTDVQPKVVEKGKELSQIIKRSKPVKLPTSVRRISGDNSSNTMSHNKIPDITDDKTDEKVPDDKSSESAEKSYNQILRDPRIRTLFQNEDRTTSNSDTTTSNTNKPVWGMSFKNTPETTKVIKSPLKISSEMKVRNVRSVTRLLDSPEEELTSEKLYESVDNNIFSTEDIVNIPEVQNKMNEKSQPIPKEKNLQDIVKKINSTHNITKNTNVPENTQPKENAELAVNKKTAQERIRHDYQSKEMTVNALGSFKTYLISNKTRPKLKPSFNINDIKKSYQKPKIGPACYKNKNEKTPEKLLPKISTSKIGSTCYKNKITNEKTPEKLSPKISMSKIGPTCFKNKININEKEKNLPKMIKPKEISPKLKTKSKIGPACFKNKIANETTPEKNTQKMKNKPKIGPACFKKSLENSTEKSSMKKNKPKIGPARYKIKKPKIGPACYKYKKIKSTHDVYHTKSNTFILKKCSVPLLKISEKNVNHYKKDGKYSSTLASTLKDYFQKNDETKVMCLICSNMYKRIVEHYVRKHPESDVFISRMSPSCLNQALKEVKLQTPKNPTLCCRFCNFTTESTSLFYCHCTSHTGEYLFKCTYCTYLAPNKSSVLTHINLTHQISTKLIKVTQLSDIKIAMNRFPAYVCRFCNFLQMNQERVLLHLHKDHKSQDIYDCMEINLASYIPDKLQLEDQSPRCGLRRKVGGAVKASTSNMTDKDSATQRAHIKPQLTATLAVPGKSTDKPALNKTPMNQAGVKRKRERSTNTKTPTDKSNRVEDDFECKFCRRWYLSSTGEWIKCMGCGKWLHDHCTNYQDHCNNCGSCPPWSYLADLKPNVSKKSKKSDKNSVTTIVLE